MILSLYVWRYQYEKTTWDSMSVMIWYKSIFELKIWLLIEKIITLNLLPKPVIYFM